MRGWFVSGMFFTKINFFFSFITGDENSIVRALAAYSVRYAFSYIPDKYRAWENLHGLTMDENSDVLSLAAYSMGAAFPHFPNKQQAWQDLMRLSGGKDTDTRVSETTLWEEHQ